MKKRKKEMFYEEGKKTENRSLQFDPNQSFRIVYGYLPNEWLLIDRTFC